MSESDSTTPTNPQSLVPPRAVSPNPETSESHPNFQDVFNAAATHIAPQRPPPEKDEERAEEHGGTEEGQDHGGVVARRAGEGDLLSDDVEVGLVDDEAEVVPVRPGLESSRIGSARGGSQALFGILGALPSQADEISDSSSPDDSSSSEDDEDESPTAKSVDLATSRTRTRTPRRMGSSLDVISTYSPAETPKASLTPLEDPISSSPAVIPSTLIDIDEHPADVISEEPESTAPSDQPVPVVVEPTSDSGSSVETRLISEEETKKDRAERLGRKLKEVFGLPDGEEVLVEMPCWSLRELLLQGYMYLTSSHICFFAHMPKTDNVIVKTGPLSRRSARTKLSTKYWFVLKNDVLSWFESSTDPYFPKGNVPLQYCLSCETKNDREIKVRTSEKTYTFLAETKASRDDWVKAITKVILKSRHEGDHVKIAIPLEAVDSVEKSPTLEFAETVEINVIDPEDTMSIDSYFFAYFRDTNKAVQEIQDLLQRFKESKLELLGQIRPIVDTMQVDKANDLSPGELLRVKSITSATSMPLPENEESVPGQGLTKAATDTTIASGSGLGRISSITSKLNPFASSSKDELSRISSRRSSNVPQEDSPGRPIVAPSIESRNMSGSVDTIRPINIRADSLTYPPAQPRGSPPPGMGDDANSGWGQKWLRAPAQMLSKAATDSSLSRSPSKVTEVLGSLIPGKGKHKVDDDDEYEQMEKSEEQEKNQLEIEEKFRKTFGLGVEEDLLDHFPGFLYRVFPVSGRFFISPNYLCFRATQLMYNTKMMIPIKDITGAKLHRAYRIGHWGLLLILKGFEELFLEFSSDERRQQVKQALEARIEDISRQEVELSNRPQSKEGHILEELDASADLGRQPHPDAAHVPGQDPVVALFGSTTSTLLDFKPDRPLNIMCLTIGSRGDVQPYIALCLGLMKEGHSTTIATHQEYESWVRGYGISFKSVGGDATLLMETVIANGTFTLKFLKEGVTKFRGWLDDLLRSSWEAAQGSDLLIESPSAMGGIHIAEGLGIPYYRAFSMPWSRTRSVPHAFAVPSSKRGGGYNWATYTLFDTVLWQAISGQINRFRREVIGLESTDFGQMAQHRVPFLYNWSPSILAPPLDWSDNIRITGYWTLEHSSDSFQPPKELVQWMKEARAAGKKIVYIGFGSIVVSDPQAMSETVVDAVAASDVWCILSKGWSERGKKKDISADEADGIALPKEIYSIDSIDHGWLFNHIDAAVHHGGAGTTGASLRAGLPTIIHPFFGDQFLWANRVDELNVGSAVRKLTKSNLTEAIIKATTDEKQIEKAKILGKAIRAEHGVAKAIEYIYRDLDYARSLIKPRPTPERSAELLKGHLRSPSLDEQTPGHRRVSSGEYGSASGSASNDFESSGKSSVWSVVSGETPEAVAVPNSDLGGSEDDMEAMNEFEGAGEQEERGGEKKSKRTGVMGVLGKVGKVIPKFGGS